MSWVTWLPKSTIRIFSCAEAGRGVDAGRAWLWAVMDRNYATRAALATLDGAFGDWSTCFAGDCSRIVGWAKALLRRAHRSWPGGGTLRFAHPTILRSNS